METITWPVAFMWVGIIWCAAWACRSFCRLLNGDKP